MQNRLMVLNYYFRLKFAPPQPPSTRICSWIHSCHNMYRLGVTGSTTVIAVYGFLKNFCPDGTYVSNILSSPAKNFTDVEITQDAYYVLAYSNMLFTLVALLTTDILQYKTVIILGASASIGTKIYLYFGTTITHIQIMQLLHAIYRASNVAYRTYVYTKVKKNSYQCATATITITPKLGTFASALLAQTLLLSHTVDLQNLVIISLIALSLSALVALVLPTVEEISVPDGKTSQEEKYSTDCQRHQQAISLLWEELKFATSNMDTIKWCVWWILSYGAFQLVTEYYIQALWNDIAGEKHSKFNGGVEALYAFFTTATCYMAGKLKIDWQRYGELALSVVTLAQAASVIASATTSSLFLSYGLYIVTGTLYDTMAIIANSQIALQLKNNGFGLIFGINTFLGIVFQATLTYIFTSKKTLALPIREQFLAIGYCYGAIGCIFLIKAFHTGLSTLMTTRTSNKSSHTDLIKTVSLNVFKSEEFK